MIAWPLEEELCPKLGRIGDPTVLSRQCDPGRLCQPQTS
jgi:hypothetical protein